MPNRARAFLLLPFLLLSFLPVLASCGSDNSTPTQLPGTTPTATPPPGTPAPTPTATSSPVAQVTFSQVQANLLEPDCVGCHSGPNPSAGLDFTTYAGVMQAVVPGNAQASRLFQEAAGGHIAGVTAAQLAELAAWINSGAPNN